VYSAPTHLIVTLFLTNATRGWLRLRQALDKWAERIAIAS
jgi:hypothetical protein